MQTPEIICTREYSQFKTVGFNREKNKRHIESLKKILLKENLLHLHPILVNEQMEVIDGQHRLEAAREMGLDVFYIKSPLSYDHILNSNLFQKKLSLNDVIKFYALKDRLEPYIKLREYLSMLEINPKAILGLMFGTVSRPVLEMIKSGKFQFPADMSRIDILIDTYSKLKVFVDEKKINPRAMFTCADFTIGFRNLVMMSAYNEKIFFSKLENRWFELRPQLNSKEWTKQLVAIYNWKNHNPLEFVDAQTY